MDLVHIGFKVDAKGLKEANNEVDSLLGKVDQIGTKGKKSASEFENSQKKVVKEVDKTSKALERQQIIGDYLGKGLDKTTASAIAGFKQLGATSAQTNSFIESLVNNKGLDQTRKDLEKLSKEQEKQAQAIKNTLAQYEKMSSKSFGGGILDAVEKQNKGMQELNNHYKSLELEQKKAADAQQKQLDKELSVQKRINDERSKAVSLEQSRVKYVKEGFSKTESGRLARLEVSGADVTTLNNYKKALEDTKQSMRSLAPVSLTAAKNNSTLLASVRGIAAYALLSTAIYGTITALTDLAVSFVETADEMTNLTQRLNIYLPANIKVNEVLERMGEIAKENRVTLADTGKLFTQLLPPIQRIKGGVAETTAIVDAFGKAMLIGGANTKEAASATIQFGQAMASGKLAGDEFRSLAEASPRLLQAIADGAGIAAQKLKEMSAAGKLTSGLVSAALLDQFIQLEYEAAKMGQTVSGAFNEGMVAYQLFVNEFNNQTGFTQSIVEGIRSVVKSLEGFGNSFLASLKDGNSTLNSFLGLMKVIWDLVGSVVGGFVDVVGWLVKAGEKTGLWKNIFDVTKVAIIAIVDTLAKIPFVIADIGTRLVITVLKPFEKFIALAQKGLDLAGFDTAAAKLGKGLDFYRSSNEAVLETTGEIISGYNLLSLGVKETAVATGTVDDLLGKLKQKNQDLVIQEKEKKAMTDQQAIAEYAKLLLQQNGVTVNAENLKKVEEQLRVTYNITQEQAKQLKQQGEIQAKKDEAEAKAKKAREDAKKEYDNALKSYQDQVGYVGRLQKLLQQGVDIEVARVAAEKEYAKNIITTGLAQEVVAARQVQARIDYQASLAEEFDILSRTIALQQKGASYEQARELAQAGFREDAEGLAVLEEKITNELLAQQYSLYDQNKTQNSLNKYLADGYSLEEATTRLTFDRLAAMTGGLSKQGVMLRDNLIAQQKQKLVLEEEQSIQQDINKINQKGIILQKILTGEVNAYAIALAKARAESPNAPENAIQDKLRAESMLALDQGRLDLQYQLNNLAKGYTSEMVSFQERTVGLTKVEAQRLFQQEKLNAILKEQQDKVDQMKSTQFGDFSGVDFDVFGDIGNPFKEALDGINAYLGGLTDVESQLGVIKQAQLDAKDALSKTSDAEAIKKLTSDLATYTKAEQDALKQKRDLTIDAYADGLKFAKSFFKEESKGYKTITVLEQALQASKIAFAIWEKKDTLAMIATKITGYAQDALAFVTGTSAKMVSQAGLNLVQAQGAVAASANAPPPVGFASAAAMIALMAGIGIAISGSGSSGSGFTATNEGVGTVFGDSEAQSASIKNSIELLSDNSDLMLPLTSAMLRSLRNIESSIGGVTNLILRQAISGTNLSVNEGFNQNFIGSFLEKAGNTFFAGIGDFLGINKMLGGLLGGLFGSKTTIKGQGLFGDAQKLGDIITKGFDLVEYIDVQVKKKTLGITTSTKNSTQFAAADEALSKQFSLIFTGFYDSILSATDILGADTNSVKTKLENAIVDIGKIDLKGLNGEQIQEKLEAVFGAAADKLAQQGFDGLDEFQKVGEGYYETLIRVAGAVEQAKYFTDRLNVTAIEYTDILNKQGDVAAEIVRQSVLLNETTKDISGGFYDLVSSFDGTAEELTDFVMTLQDLQDQLFMTGKNADYLTSAMILGAGGIDKLSSGLDAYFEMLSPAEQAAELTRRLTNEFAIFGKELPADVKAFRALVSSIDISTEAGQKLYGQILALAPEFNDLQDALEAANSDINELVNSLRDLAEQARAARGETEVVRNLDYLRNEFNKASELAMQGDVDAANRLLELGSSLMNASKLYSLSSSEYARDLALIQRAATVAADVQESGLGTSISTDLSTSSGTNTTPTLETTDTSATSEISALREEMMAGLYSIAKFVQNLDSRTERWDDGTRVLVGIQPEVGDTPLTVTVTP